MTFDEEQKGDAKETTTLGMFASQCITTNALIHMRRSLWHLTVAADQFWKSLWVLKGVKNSCTFLHRFAPSDHLKGKRILCRKFARVVGWIETWIYYFIHLLFVDSVKNRLWMERSAKAHIVPPLITHLYAHLVNRPFKMKIKPL